jgi:hypothetical protein
LPLTTNLHQNDYNVSNFHNLNSGLNVLKVLIKADGKENESYQMLDINLNNSINFSNEDLKEIEEILNQL